MSLSREVDPILNLFIPFSCSAPAPHTYHRFQFFLLAKSCAISLFAFIPSVRLFVTHKKSERYSIGRIG